MMVPGEATKEKGECGARGKRPFPRSATTLLTDITFVLVEITPETVRDDMGVSFGLKSTTGKDSQAI